MSAQVRFCECGRIWMRMSDAEWDENGSLAWCHECIGQAQMAADAWSNDATLIASAVGDD